MKLTIAQEVKTHEHRPCAKDPHAGGGLMTFTFMVSAALMVIMAYAPLRHGAGQLSWGQA